MALNDVFTIRGPSGTVAAIETAAGLAGQTPPDFLRGIIARALTDAAAKLVKPVKRTRRSYPYRGGLVVDAVEEHTGALDEADSNG